MSGVEGPKGTRVQTTVYKDAYVKIAEMVGDSVVMDIAANMVLDAVRAKAEEHRDTGHYVESLRIAKLHGKHVNDRYVYADDENAIPIEYGWISKHNGKHHSGQYIFWSAFLELKHRSL